MAKKNEVLEVLVSPEGDREWIPEDAEQATNLRAQGWAPKVEDDVSDDGAPSSSKPTK